MIPVIGEQKSGDNDSFHTFDVEFYCSVKTDLLKDGAISRLFIAFASKRDSGNYTCSMRNAQASVVVHILDGELKWALKCS